MVGINAGSGVLLALWGLQSATLLLALSSSMHDSVEIPDILRSPEFDDLTSPFQVAECFVAVQIVKKIPGQCVKLGKTNKGCMAGNLLHPFHPDCESQRSI